MQEQNLDSAFVHYYVTQSKIKISKDKKEESTENFHRPSFYEQLFGLPLSYWSKAMVQNCPQML